jgi:hypothetical protein
MSIIPPPLSPESDQNSQNNNTFLCILEWLRLGASNYTDAAGAHRLSPVGWRISEFVVCESCQNFDLRQLRENALCEFLPKYKILGYQKFYILHLFGTSMSCGNNSGLYGRFVLWTKNITYWRTSHLDACTSTKHAHPLYAHIIF